LGWKKEQEKILEVISKVGGEPVHIERLLQVRLQTREKRLDAVIKTFYTMLSPARNRETLSNLDMEKKTRVNYCQTKESVFVMGKFAWVGTS